MKIPPPPGMRDFYPDEMRLQNWLFEQWRSVARNFGFSEYDGPIFEFLELYTVKSGEGIVNELFHFSDRGERRFAIRPEMTPTLARMVAARGGALPRPIKWFSVSRMCRAERPQRGRLREFFQWNADVLGVDDPLADAEVMAVALEFLRRVGLGPTDVVMRFSSRPLAIGLLEALGIDAQRAPAAFDLLDQREKIEPAAFAELWQSRVGASTSAAALDDLLSLPLQACRARLDANPQAQAAAQTLMQLEQHLQMLGVAEYCRFDLRVVRGLAYYTGPVFEVHALRGGLRAIAGGGRYDSLVSLLDGPVLPGVGFGMGDAVLIELLRELERLPVLSESLDVFVIDADESLFPEVLQTCGRLRRQGYSVDASYKRQNVGKQFKQAAARGARFALLLGDEYQQRREMVLKDLQSGRQQVITAEQLFSGPRLHELEFPQA